MDEPLSNLDAALRVQMRSEIGHLHERFKVTTIHVTHDQVEAMTMGNRIAVMSEGRLQQIDTPDAIYENPATLFVARFIGSPKMNIVPAQLTTADGTPVVALLGMTVPVERGRLLAGAGSGDVLAGVRPEDLAWSRFGGGEHTFSATVDLVEPMGPEVYVTVKAGEHELISRFPPRCGVQPGDTVELELHPDRLHLFDPRSEQSLLTPQLVSERVSTPGTKTASAAPVDGS